MRVQRQTTTKSEAGTHVVRSAGDMQDLIEAARASLVAMKKSTITIYEELHRFYVHFATSPGVDVCMPGTAPVGVRRLKKCVPGRDSTCARACERCARCLSNASLCMSC
nr:hypothetical protein [Pandoravirus aubagnensis]